MILLNYINYRGLLLALAALVPVVFYYLKTADILASYLGLISVSLVIVKDKLHLTLKHSIYHYLATIVAFSLLYFAYSEKVLFVIITALIALFTILITQRGGKLRTLGNYIFIPAVYIGCELRMHITEGDLIPQYMHFLELTLICLLSHIAVHLLFKDKLNEDFGLPEVNWFRPSLIILISVTLATSSALLLHLEHLQWAIWSSASVILASFDQTKIKVEHRITGLIIGVPLALALIQILPKSEVIYIISLISAVLTLIAFKNYTLAFTIRCFLVVIVAGMGNFAIQASEERIESVLLGGAIGVICSYIFKGQR